MWPFNRKKKQELERGFKNPAKRSSAWETAKDGDLLADWKAQSMPINVQLKAELRKTRGRSRDISKNDPFAIRFLTLAKNNVVGANGITLQPMIKTRDGKKIDRDACKAVFNAWADFSKKKNFEITRRQSRHQIEKSIITHLLRDGEYLILEIVGKDAGNKYGYSIQFLDPEVLNVDHNMVLENGNEIIMGIEHDPVGRAVAYHLSTKNTRGDDTYSWNGRNYQRIPADRIIHGYIQEYADQSRGIPHFAPIGFRLKMLDGYDEAELVSARIGASKMGIWERQEGAEDWEGDEQDDGSFIDEVTPGAIEIGPEGYTFNSFNPTHPSQAFEPFRKGMIRSIAAALGVSYHQLANDLEGVNYSSGRLGALEDREVWIGLQKLVIEDFSERVFERWLHSALALGAIKLESGATLGGEKSPIARLNNHDRYCNVRHQGRRWPWVDPQKDIKANVEAINARITTVSAVIREQGQSPADVFEEWAEERQIWKDLGIDEEPAKAGFLLDEENDEPDNQEDQEDG